VRPSGSPKTTKAPAIELRFVAAVISAITTSGASDCRPRWKAKNAPPVAASATASHGEASAWPAPVCPVTAFIARSPAP
jgi:hypothetical protein